MLSATSKYTKWISRSQSDRLCVSRYKVGMHPGVGRLHLLPSFGLIGGIVSGKTDILTS